MTTLQQRMPLVATMMVGAFVGVLNQTLLTTALPVVMEYFNISSSSAQWMTTIFMLVNGIMIPITAFLVAKYTTKTLFNIALILFIIGSLLCMLAPHYYILLAGRAIQAAGAGILMPLMQIVLFLSFPPEKRGVAMGMFGLVIGFAPAIGPTLSGWIVNNYPWQVLFLIVLTISIADMILGFFLMKNITELSYPKLDILSVITSTFGFGGLLLGFSRVGQMGWNHLSVWLTLIVSAVVLYLFIHRQLKLEKPMLEFRIFKIQTFRRAMILIVIMFMLFIGSMTILPIFIQRVLHLTPLMSGLIMLPGGLLMGVLAPVFGRLYDKFGGRVLGISGMALIAIAAFMLSRMNLHTDVRYIVIFFCLLMIGNACIMTPMTTEAMNALSGPMIPHGTAMNNTIRQISAAIGTSLLVTIMTSTGAGNAVHGIQVTYLVIASLAIVGLLVAFSLKKRAA